MNRRNFIQSLAAPPLAALGANETVTRELAGKSLEELRDFHRRELFSEYIALWDKSGIDWQYGGFFPEANVEGDPRKVTDKEMYYQGRGLWVFSYIYNHFERHERHLKAARLAREFLVKNCRDSRGYWISKFTRDGKRLEPSTNIYGDIYMVLGLAEYYQAAGAREDLDLAVESAYGVMERVVSPAYQHLAGHGASHEPGTKRLGTWQHFLSALTPLLRHTRDEGIDNIARMCVRNIMERHWRPEYGVMLEHLDDRFEPFKPDPQQHHRIVSGWHSIQAAWMSMEEALRRNHQRMFTEALEMGRRTMERCWVDGKRFSGLVSLEDPEQRPVEPATINGIASGALDDALVFCLMAIEHTGEAWACDWYNKVFATGYRNPERWRRRCLLHHPRRLFLSLQILDRVIGQGGRVSGFLKKA